MLREIKASDFMTGHDRNLFAIISDYCIKVELDMSCGLWQGIIGKYPDDSADDLIVTFKTPRVADKSLAMTLAINGFNQFYADKEMPVREINKSHVSYVGGCSVYAANGYLGVSSIVTHGNISTSIFKLDTLEVVASSICHAAQIEPAAELVTVWNNKFPPQPSLDAIVDAMKDGRAVGINDILYYLRRLQRLESNKTP